MNQLKVSYINHMGSDLTIVNSARISFGSTSQVLTEKDKKLIKYLAANKHYSPFEHCTLTALIECPLYIRSQIMRHRTFSYNEVSRRYTSEDIQFYSPELRKQAISNRQASDGLLEAGVGEAKALIEKQHQEAYRAYKRLLELGVAREIARGVLSQDLMTKFYMTGNLRNWAHFVSLRLDAHAQIEVQYIANEVKTIMLNHFPEATKALLGV